MQNPFSIPTLCQRVEKCRVWYAPTSALDLPLLLCCASGTVCLFRSPSGIVNLIVLDLTLVGLVWTGMFSDVIKPPSLLGTGQGCGWLQYY